MLGGQPIRITSRRSAGGEASAPTEADAVSGLVSEVASRSSSSGSGSADLIIIKSSVIIIKSSVIIIKAGPVALGVVWPTSQSGR